MGSTLPLVSLLTLTTVPVSAIPIAVFGNSTFFFTSTLSSSEFTAGVL